MKRTFILPAIILLITFCFPVHAPGQDHPMNQDSLIRKDTMNFAVLVLDFLTYKFEKASVEYLPLCTDCDRDSLPLTVYYRQPGDFGEIRFLYSETSDTLFGATIIWNGTGSIFHPVKFQQASEFPFGNKVIEKPADARYYDFTLTPYMYSKEDYFARADSAWKAINSLEIVNEFASRPFRAGFYAYPPSVGVFCPSCAKWIVFLYSGNPFGQQVISSAVLDKLTVYPNPATDEIIIDFRLFPKGMNMIQIYDARGYAVIEEIADNTQIKRIDVSRLINGFYYVRVKGLNDEVGKKMLIINN